MNDNEAFSLITNLRSINESIRTISINKIVEISKILRIERTINELIPYIIETPLFTEMQWVMILEQILKINFIEFDESILKLLFNNLLPLAKLGSRIIRAKLVECYSEIAFGIYGVNIKIESILVEFIWKMIKDKISEIVAVGISFFANACKYDMISDNNCIEIFMYVYNNVLTQSLMVKQYFVASCPLMITRIGGILILEILDVITKLSFESSIFILCEIPKSLIEIMKINPNKKIADIILDIGKRLLDSKNMLVKCSYINSFSKIFENYILEFNDVYNFFNMIISDKKEDDEVKTAVTKQLNFLAKTKDFNKYKIKDIFKDLFELPCSHIKAAAVMELSYFISILDDNYIIEQFTKLSKDPEEEVSISTIETLKSNRISNDIKLKCIEIPKDSTKWREKKEIIHLIENLSNKTELFEIDHIFISLLFDDVYNIRKLALDLLPKIIKLRKSLSLLLIETLKEKIKDIDYQIRQTAVLAILKGEIFDDNGMNILESAINDEVSNVRITLAINLPKDKKFEHLRISLLNDKEQEVIDYLNCNF